MDHAGGLLVFAVLLLSPAFNVVGTRIPAAPPCNFPAIYNFGDSDSDTGAISAAFGPIPPPYGESFFGGPAGRQSDGRLIIDFIAEHLGLPYLTSYLDSMSTSFRHGANFAAGGATICGQNETETMFQNGTSPFSLDIQMEQFDQFKARTTKRSQRVRNPCDRSSLPKPQEFSRALYTFSIGQNDLITGFRKLTEAQLLAAFPDMIKQLEAAVTHLYQQGARAFWIHNTAPVGCLPAASFSIRNPKPDDSLDKYGCIRGQNAMAAEFNRQLKGRVIELRKELPQASLIYVDVYSATYHLISNSSKYGFMDSIKVCCGHHDRHINLWCGQRTMIDDLEISGVSCNSPESYISWDGLHYTQAANQWIANHILNGLFCDPPIPITHACLM